MKVQWNSTYNMLMKSHEIRIPLQMLVSVNQNLKEYYPTDKEWQMIYQLIVLLKPIEKGTQLLYATNYPTLALIHCVFNEIQYYLDNYIENNKDISLAMIASSMKQKISEYWSIIDKSSIVATILDPRYKTIDFFGLQAEDAKNKLQMIFTSYSTTFTTENIHIPVSTSQNLNKYFASLNNRNPLTANNPTQISSKVE
ncbi:198_t:CDS:1 [Funneliformis geosporum]|uniref:198_t:CDS:1 n=1 Tax=Funneliformis geosporum TaxID=1117311 RepID=A0A9W4X347_9GLOM|nr:198_t:CDS:1 [Funneliformis geosporum]